MAQQVSVTLDQAVRPEGNPGDDQPTQFDFLVTRSGTTNEALDVNWEILVAGTDPAEVNDFAPEQPTSGTVIFDAGVEEQTVSVFIARDLTVELDEQFTLALDGNGLPEGTTLGTASAVATISNDDPTTVTITPSLVQALDEGDPSGSPATFSYTLTREGDLSQELTVNWQVTPQGDFAVDPDDFGGTLPNDSVTFEAGASEANTPITFAATTDSAVEADEQFQVELSLADDAPAGTILGLDKVSGRILNDDDDEEPPPEVAITPADVVHPEGDAEPTLFTFTVTRTGDPRQETTVEWDVKTVDDLDLAVNLEDFVEGSDTSGTVTFEAGDDAPQTITVQVQGDLMVEGDEAFKVELSNAQNATISETAGSAVGTILEDDLPEVSLTGVAPSSAELEGNPGDPAQTVFTFTLTRTGDDLSQSSSVDWAVNHQTTVAADFTSILDGRVTFAANEPTATFDITVNNEDVFEGDEAFKVVLSNADKATIGTGELSATILNDDTALINGTPGNDVITLNDVSEGVTGGQPSDADDTIDALGGNDIVDGGGGTDTIEGGGGNDVLLGGAGHDTLTDSDFGNDILLGGTGNDVLDGGKGDDTLDGGADDDTLDGGIGLDTLRGGDDNDILRGGDGADVLQGEAGDDTLTGGEGNDLLDGGDENDTLDGGVGHDTLDGGAGNDTLTGGTGVDIYVFSGDNGADTITDYGVGSDLIDLSAYGLSSIDDFDIKPEGDDTVISGYNGAGNTITLENFDASGLGPENFILDPDAKVIVGTVNDDTITPDGISDGVTGTPSDGPDVIKALDGNDTVDGGGGNDVIDGSLAADTLDGGEGNDVVAGGEGDDTLNGGEGSDVLRGEGGADTLDGGAGNDTLEGGTGVDTFVFAGDNGADRITDFEDGADLIDLSAYGEFVWEQQDGDTVIFGYDNFRNEKTANTITLENVDASGVGPEDFIVNPNVNVIVGTVNDDVITPDQVSDGVTGTPSDGRDVIKALGGNDTVYGGGGNDTLDGGAGKDTLDGGPGKDVLAGGEGNDTLNGGEGPDRLRGEGGADNLDGGPGQDILEGGEGEDDLRGGDDGDTLVGGDNDDTLDGGGGSDILEGEAGADVLAGGEGSDLLFGGDGNDDLDGGDDADRLLGGDGNDTLQGGDGSDEYVFAGDNGADTITDFQDGSDRINFRAYNVLSIDDFDINPDGDDTVISGYDGADNTVTLQNVNASALGNESFIFAPPLAITAITRAQLEGNSDTTPFEFQVTRTGDLDQALTLDYRVLGSDPNPATLGEDLLDLDPDGFGQVTISPGERVAQFTVTVAGDTLEEANESFTVELFAPDTSVADTARAFILNDDQAPPPPELSIADVSQAEGNSSTTDLVFTVTRTGDDLDQTTTVAWTATPSGDDPVESGDFKFGTLASGDLEFLPEVKEQTITFAVLGDTEVEGNETLTVTLDTPVNATISRATATGTILNDDAPPPPELSIADVSQAEGNSDTTDLVFTVTRTGDDLNQTTTVAWTATPSGDDPVESSDVEVGTRESGDLEFLPGVKEQTITFAVVGDTEVEGNETLTVTLDTPVNATISRATATGTIENDDQGVNVINGTEEDDRALDGTGDDDIINGLGGEDVIQGFGGNDIIDGGEDEDTLSGGSGADIFVFAGSTNDDLIKDFEDGVDKIDLSAYPDTRFSDLDIEQERNSLNTEIGEYGSFGDKITVKNIDPVKLTPEDFIFAGPGNSIYISDVQIEEGNGDTPAEAVYNVTLSTPVDAAVTVDYATANGTATAGSDYTAVSGTLTFAPNETEQEVRVPITGDGALEPNESFFVNLSNPVNDVIADGQGQATILDDDAVSADQTAASADEVFDGTDGDDILQGGNGDDALSGADGDDALSGRSGDDAIDGGAGDDLLAGGSGDDTLDGGVDDDVLGGGSGNDVLEGGAGDDALAGGSGDDQLSGGAGNDALIGGSGYDSFIYKAADGDSGHDTIRLFNADEDTLAFEEYGDNLNAFSDLDTNANGVLDDGDAHVSVNAGNTVIDLGGQTDGASDGTLTLVGVTELQEDVFSFN